MTLYSRDLLIASFFIFVSIVFSSLILSYNIGVAHAQNITYKVNVSVSIDAGFVHDRVPNRVSENVSISVGNVRGRITYMNYTVNTSWTNDLMRDLTRLTYNVDILVDDIRDKLTYIKTKIQYSVCENLQNLCYLFKPYEPPPPDSGGGNNSSSGDGGWGQPDGSGDFPPVVWNTVLDVGYLVILVGISFLPVLVFGRRGLGGTLVLLALYSEAGLIDSWIVALAAILLLALIFIEVRGGGEGGG